jgi:hypothetical protein
LLTLYFVQGFGFQWQETGMKLLCFTRYENERQPDAYKTFGGSNITRNTFNVDGVNRYRVLTFTPCLITINARADAMNVEEIFWQMGKLRAQISFL